MTEFHKSLWDASIETEKAAAAEMGVNFYEVDAAPFRAAVAPMYDELDADKQAIVAQIRAAGAQ